MGLSRYRISGDPCSGIGFWSAFIQRQCEARSVALVDGMLRRCVRALSENGHYGQLTSASNVERASHLFTYSLGSAMSTHRRTSVHRLLLSVFASVLSVSCSGAGNEVPTGPMAAGVHRTAIATSNLEKREPETEHDGVDHDEWEPGDRGTGVILTEAGSGILKLIRADGSGSTSAPSLLYHADLSHDGRRLVYTRVGSQTLWTSNIDGTGEVAISSNSAPQYVPRWSRDDLKIVWTRETNWGGAFREVFTMNADGTAVRQLTNNPGMDEVGQWSPDGRKIVFMSERTGPYDIYSMNADGSGLAQLTTGGWTADPEYSPNGKLILFTRVLPLPGVFVMKSDGTGVRALVTDPCLNFGESGAHFSPDGKRVAFVACFGGANRDVYTVRLDGTGLTRLTNTPSIDEYVRSWR